MELAFLTADMKKKCKISIVALFFFCISAFAQQEKENNDTFPRPIPDVLSPELFIPKSRLLGFQPWTFAPLPRPVVYILPTFGSGSSIGFGEYAILILTIVVFWLAKRQDIAAWNVPLF